MASITKRGKKWRARASYVDAKGIRQQPSKTFDTKKAATEWATRLENQIFDGSDINAGKILFPEYFKEWMEINKKGNVRKATYHSYLITLKFIEDAFGNVALEKLTTSILQKQLNKYGKTHKVGTVKIILSKIKSALNDAYIDGIIKRDIFSRLKANGLEPDHKINFLNAKDFEKLKEFLYTHAENMTDSPFLLMALIALETGMRIGEVQALTKDDISNNIINVNKSYSRMTNETTKPKTKSSIRDITISQSLTKLIENYVSNINTEKLFVRNISSTYVTKYMRELTEAADVPFIHFHGLRHSHVSYLLYSGVDIQYISKRVGHANTGITMKVYSHMLKEKEQAQEELTLKILNYSDQ